MKKLAGLVSCSCSFALGTVLALTTPFTPLARADDGSPCPTNVPATGQQNGAADASTPPPAAADPSSPTTPAPPSDPPVAAPPSAAAPTLPPIAFSELLPDPVGDDSQEFIEIANLGDSDADIAGWKIADAKGHSYAIADEKLGAKGFRYFLYPESKIRLANTGGSLSLISPDGAARDSVAYVAPVPEGRSFSKFDDGWKWTSHVTPGGTNVADVTNDTAPPQPPAAGGKIPDSAPIQAEYPLAPQFAALLPNPVGSDQGEWLELRDASSSDIPLGGWKIVDARGNSSPLDGMRLSANGSLRLSGATLKVALNNDAENLRLVDPTGATRDSVHYENAVVGSTYENIDGTWRWSGGDPPVIPPAAPVTSATDTAPGTAADSIPAASTATAETVSDLETLDPGMPVSVGGVITLPPGVIGKTVLAIRDEGGESGAFIKVRGGGSMPKLEAGDSVTILGKVSAGPYKLLASLADVKVNGKGKAVPAAERGPVEVDGGDEGLAVKLSGIVAGRGKRWLSLADEQADAVIKAVFARGEAPPTKQGDSASVVGVVRMRDGTPEIVVLSPADASFTPKITAPPVPSDAGADPKTAPAPADVRPTLVLDSRAERPIAAFAALALAAGAVAAGYFLWKRGRFA